MKVGQVRVKSTADSTAISADIEGFTLSYQLSGLTSPLEPRGDCFAAACLIPAMVRGEALEIDVSAPVSPRLIRGVDRIQDVLSLWNPRLHKIAINARVEPAPRQSQRTASFFSGGVDSGYTLIKHVDEIDDLILVHGLDISLSEEQVFKNVARNVADVASRFRKAYTTAVVNAREFCEYFGITMALFHGALLSSVALMLGRCRTYIPSTHRYNELEPWGSHILLDEHWSTEGCDIVHDGAEASRPQKLKRIAGSRVLLDVLRVCSAGGSEYNCGKCEKCIRTMITLNILGVHAARIPKVPNTQLLRQLTIHNDQQLHFLEQNYEMAVQKGDVLTSRCLKKLIRRYLLRRLTKEADNFLLGGTLQELFRRFRPKRPESKVVNVVGRAW